MSIQMTLVFVTLCVEMVILFLMVLPLPHGVRRKIIHTINLLNTSSHYRIGITFLSIILGLQFVDCLNKLRRYDYLKNPYFTSSNMGSPSSMLTNDQLASKFYAQRNLYISGAVLFLELAIFTVSTILRKMVLKEDRLRSFNVKSDSGDKKDDNKGEQEEVEKYQELIKSKDKDIATMKKQIEGLQRSYDELTPETKHSKDD